MRLALLLAMGCLVSLGLAPFAVLAAAPPRGGPNGGPMLVVAPPWGGGAAAVVERAGARLAGPSEAPFSVIASGVGAGALWAAGAWVVLDARRLAEISGWE